MDIAICFITQSDIADKEIVGSSSISHVQKCCAPARHCICSSIEHKGTSLIGLGIDG